MSAGLLFPGGGRFAGTASPSAGAGLPPHRDLESASLLLMSTSKSLSFALMCLYSLYSSAIGVRSSFWTLLMGTNERGLRTSCRLLDDAAQQVQFINPQNQYQCGQASPGSSLGLGLDKQRRTRTWHFVG